MRSGEGCSDAVAPEDEMLTERVMAVLVHE